MAPRRCSGNVSSFCSWPPVSSPGPVSSLLDAAQVFSEVRSGSQYGIRVSSWSSPMNDCSPRVSSASCSSPGPQDCSFEPCPPWVFDKEWLNLWSHKYWCLDQAWNWYLVVSFRMAQYILIRMRIITAWEQQVVLSQCTPVGVSWAFRAGPGAFHAPELA